MEITTEMASDAVPRSSGTYRLSSKKQTLYTSHYAIKHSLVDNKLSEYPLLAKYFEEQLANIADTLPIHRIVFHASCTTHQNQTGPF